MKKVLIILGVFVLIGVLMIAVPFSLHANVQGLRSEMNIHTLSYAALGNVLGTANGTEVSMSDDEIQSFSKLVTMNGLRSRIFNRKDGADAITVVFPDGAKFCVFTIESKLEGKDTVFIRYTYQGKKRCYTLEGYGLFEKFLKTVSPQSDEPA